MNYRLIILLVASVFLALPSSAAEPLKVQNFEGGLATGAALPLGGYYDGKTHGGITFDMSLRYNLPETPWDCGLKFELGGISREYKYTSPYFNETYDMDGNSASFSFLLTGAYNFRQGHKVNPFVGVGFGPSIYWGTEYLDNIDHQWTLCVNPHIGVELWSHLRITLEALVMRKGFNRCALTIGFVIGGRRK